MAWGGEDHGQRPVSAVARKQGLSPQHPAQAQWQHWSPALPGGLLDLPPQVPQCGQGSRKEDHKDDEEDNEDEENFDHEPPVGGDRLEVLEDL